MSEARGQVGAKVLMQRPPIGLRVVATAVLAAVVPLPLAALLLTSTGGGEGLSRYQSVVGDGLTVTLLLRTLASSITITAVSGALGLATAFGCLSLRGPVSALATVLVGVPLSLNVVVTTLTSMVMLGYAGVLNALLHGFGAGPVDLVGSRWAAGIGLVLMVYPYVTLAILLGVSRVPPSIIVASAALGSSRLGTYFRVLIPMSFGWIGTSLALVFATAAGAYFLPDVLGGPQSSLISSQIEDAVLQSFDVPRAAAISVLALLLQMPAVLLFMLAAKRIR